MKELTTYLGEGFYSNVGSDSALVKHWFEQSIPDPTRIRNLYLCYGQITSRSGHKFKCYIDLTDDQHAVFCEGTSKSLQYSVDYSQVKDIIVLDPKNTYISVDLELDIISFREFEVSENRATPKRTKRRVVYVYDTSKHKFELNKQLSKL